MVLIKSISLLIGLLASASVVSARNTFVPAKQSTELLDVLHASRRLAGKRDLAPSLHRAAKRGTEDAVSNATNAVTTPTIADSIIVTILDSTASFSLAYDSTGNFYLDTAAMQDTYPFTVLDGKVFGGNGDNVMWYYPDELAATGVSRFRQGSLDGVPVGSQMINLMPFGDSTVYLMPIAPTSGKILTPIYCTYKGVGSRIFLTENIAQGMSSLMDPANQVIITGGVITWCGPVMFPTDMPSL